MPGITPKGYDILDLAYLHKKVDTERLFENGENAIIFIELKRALKASETHSTDKNTILFASTTIKRILTIITSEKKRLPSDFFHLLILYIRRVWDYQADVVCHETVDIFTLLINCHLNQCIYCLERKPEENAGNCDWISEMVQWLLDPTTICRSRFKCLLSLINTCPSLCFNLTPDFFVRTYIHLNNPTLSGVICELIVAHLCDNDDLWHFHASSIKQFVCKNDPKVIKNRLLHLIEKRSMLRQFLEIVLEELKKSTLETAELDLMMEICRSLIKTYKNPRKKHSGLESAKIISWVDLLPHSLMLDSIIHVDIEVGVSAWKLIIDHPKRTFPLTETDIDFMKVFLDSNMTVQSASARQTILATFKLALQRMSIVCEPALKIPEEDKPDLTYFELYADFLKHIAKLSFESLSPKGNFNRRIMALMLIEVLYTKENYITNEKERFVNHLKLDHTLGSDRLKMVLGCLDDSYDLCQTVALRILTKIDFGDFELNENEFLQESTKMMSSTKSRNTSASGYRMQYFMSRYPNRLQSLLTKFFDECCLATSLIEQNLVSITTNSVHPLLNTIELLLSTSKIEDFQTEWLKEFLSNRLIPLCHRIVNVVTPVVHNLSPEGFIPETKLCEIEKSARNESYYAELSQHLLVCCWRAHKNISGIFSWIIRVVGNKYLDNNQIDSIGNFYWTQLTECKHRGAFECAVEGFQELCKFLWLTNEAKIIDWLDEILNAVKGGKDLSNLCSTRRSAGLPHLIVAIVSTEPEKNNQAGLKKTTKSLLEMRNKTEKYRIHSLNVMKGIILSSALSNKITYALEETLYVAISACQAEWSERNAASQLFAAVRTRIFGVSRTVQRTLSIDAKNQQSNYEFFSKFPKLYRFLFEQLEDGNDKRSEFALLPSLVVLTHLISPPSSSDIYPLCSFVPRLLRIALIERRENLRAHAVASILAIADIDVKLDLCAWIEQFDYSNARQNHIHCCLLLIEGLSKLIEHSHRMNWVIKNIMKSLPINNWCDYNLSILLNLANQFEIDYDVDEVGPIEKLVLTKRPLARKLLSDHDVLKTEMGVWVRDVEIRREIYRLIRKEGWNVCTKYLRAYIVSLATKDLATSREENGIPQCEAKIIMDILEQADDFINDGIRGSLERIVEEMLDDPNSKWTLHSTRSSAIQIKYLNNFDYDDDLIDWIESAFELEDFEAKEIALNVGCRLVSNLHINVSNQPNFYKPKEMKLIAAVAMYLQDDDVDVRKKASTILTPIVNCATRAPLNPAICRLLIAKWVLEMDEVEQNEKVQIEEEDEEKNEIGRDELYDACAVNSFVEYDYFGDVRLYESLLQRMGGVRDVFELEMD